MIGHSQGVERGLGVPGYLGLLAREARASKKLDVRGHSGPDIAPTQVAKESIAPSMGYSMGSSDDLLDQGRRNHGTRGSWGKTDVTKELESVG